jgi:uncharacterized membrane protein (DUF2068 family)
VPWRKGKKPTNRYELFTCARKGHSLVGTRSEQVTPADHMLVRETDGVRLHRCLRCDDWVMRPIPGTPTRPDVEQRHEIKLPARGPALRDRYVLRLIAFDRFIHVVILTLLALLLFFFASHHHDLQRDYNNIMNDLSGGDQGSTQARGYLGYLRRAFKYSPSSLIKLGFVLTAYAALEATEMVGLWFAKRWAEYLTFIATTLLVPFEVYELSEGFSVFKIFTLIINLAVVIYLLLAKRLFGLRGGHVAEKERRVRLGGWNAIESATVEPVTAA